MFGYDWPRLHAALNDLPAALLLFAVLFDVLGALLKRDSLKTAGFWTLIAGVLGTGAAVLAGEMAADVVEHSDQAHEIMETHETLGIVVLALFSLLAVWRIVRKGSWGAREEPVALTAGAIGVAVLTYTAMLGGKLMFDHAVGIPMSQMHEIEEQRGSEEHHHGAGTEHEHEHAVPPDTARAAGADTLKAPADSARTHTHTHADGTSHTHRN